MATCTGAGRESSKEGVTPIKVGDDKGWKERFKEWDAARSWRKERQILDSAYMCRGRELVKRAVYRPK